MGEYRGGNAASSWRLAEAKITRAPCGIGRPNPRRFAPSQLYMATGHRVEMVNGAPCGSCTSPAFGGLFRCGSSASLEPTCHQSETERGSKQVVPGGGTGRCRGDEPQTRCREPHSVASKWPRQSCAILSMTSDGPMHAEKLAHRHDCRWKPFRGLGTGIRVRVGPPEDRVCGQWHSPRPGTLHGERPKPLAVMELCGDQAPGHVPLPSMRLGWY
jgi:hypothetical protein